jgi:hypothetical protein
LGPHARGADAAVATLVIPVYICRNLHLHDVVTFGVLLAALVIIIFLLACPYPTMSACASTGTTGRKSPFVPRSAIRRWDFLAKK